jgi:hypothetical protein
MNRDHHVVIDAQALANGSYVDLPSQPVQFLGEGTAGVKEA